jgi:sugar lactone lactonase YvrE
VPPLEVVAAFRAPGRQPCGLAWDGARLWHSDAAQERIYCLDPHDGSVVRDFGCPFVRTCLAWDGASLWQIAGRPKRLKCLDPDDGFLRRELELGSEQACGLELDGDVFWLSDEGGRIELRSLDDGRLLRKLAAEPGVAGIALADGVLWYAVDQLSLLVAVDPATGAEQARHPVEGKPGGLTWDGTRLWYADVAGRRIVAVSAP